MALLTISDIVARSGFRRETIWRKREAGKFPRPLPWPGHPRWPEWVIDAWLDDLSYVETSPAWQEAAGRFWRAFHGQPGRAPRAPKRYDQLQQLLARVESEMIGST